MHSSRSRAPAARARGLARAARRRARCPAASEARHATRPPRPGSRASPRSPARSSTIGRRCGSLRAKTRRSASARRRGLALRGRVDQVGNASACARSSLPLRNARRVNSPGAARRAQPRGSGATTSCNAAGLPCPCNSSDRLAGVRRRRRKQQREALGRSGSPRAPRKVAKVRSRVERSGDDGARRSADVAPDTRTMPMPPRPAGVAIAAMVSAGGCGRALTGEAYPAHRTRKVGKVGSDSTFLSVLRNGTQPEDLESRV